MQKVVIVTDSVTSIPQELRRGLMMGSLLKIKPIISMKDGFINSVGQARSRQKEYQIIFEKVSKVVSESCEIKVANLQSNALFEIEKIKELIVYFTIVAESLTAEIHPTLGVHTRPGTAGLCFFPVIDKLLRIKKIDLFVANFHLR